MRKKIIEDAQIDEMPYLIVETSHTDGMLEDIFAKNMENLKKFGEVLQASTKLIGGDIGFLVKLTFSRLKSVEAVANMKKEHFGKRKELLKTISTKSDELMDQWPDGKITSMMVAPGVFFTSSALNGMGKVTSPEFREAIGEFGFAEIPVLGPLVFGKQQGTNPFSQMAKCEPGDGECMASAFAALSKGGGGGSGEEKGLLSKLATSINNIFLISHAEIGGHVLLEADDDEDAPEEVKLTQEQEGFIKKEIAAAVQKHFKELRAEYFESQEKYYDKIVEEAHAVLSLNSQLTGATDAKSFLEALDGLKKVGGDKASDIDTEKIKTTMGELAEKIRKDEKSMKQIEKDFEKNKTEKTEENVNQKVEELVLSSMKSSFLQEIKNNMTDYYEEVYTTVSGGVGTDELKILKKTEEGAEFVEMVDKYQGKLKEAIDKMG